MPFSTFNDLTKKSSDLLSDDFSTDVSAKIKAKNNNLTWAAKATNKENKVGTSLEGTYKANGNKVVAKFEAGTKDKVTWKLSNDGLVEGIKFYGDASYDTDYSGKAGVTITEELFTADVNLKGCKDARLNVSVVGGVDAFAVGANVTYRVHKPEEKKDEDTKEESTEAAADAKAEDKTEDKAEEAAPAEEPKAEDAGEAEEAKEEEEDKEFGGEDLIDLDLRVAYEANDAQAVVVLENKFKTVGLELFYELNESTQFAAKWGWNYNAEENAHAIEFGAQHQLNEDTSVKGKFANEILSLACVNQINKNVVIKVAAQSDVTDLATPANNKVGLGIEFSN